MEEKTPLSNEIVCIQDFGASKSNCDVRNQIQTCKGKKYFFLENYVASEGGLSQCFIPSAALHCLLPSKFLC